MKLSSILAWRIPKRCASARIASSMDGKTAMEERKAHVQTQSELLRTVA